MGFNVLQCAWHYNIISPPLEDGSLPLQKPQLPSRSWGSKRFESDTKAVASCMLYFRILLVMAFKVGQLTSKQQVDSGRGWKGKARATFSYGKAMWMTQWFQRVIWTTLICIHPKAATTVQQDTCKGLEAGSRTIKRVQDPFG